MDWYVYTDAILNGDIAGGFHGISVSPAGDFNGDGRDDVLVGGITGMTNGYVICTLEIIKFRCTRA
jgi:hypothetical protein